MRCWSTSCAVPDASSAAPTSSNTSGTSPSTATRTWSPSTSATSGKIDKPFRRRSLETVRGMGYRLLDDRLLDDRLHDDRLLDDRLHDDGSHDDLDGIGDRRRGAVRREWAPIHVREPARRGFVGDGGQPPP